MADQLQQTTARCVIVFVFPEMFREFGDPSREDGHLDLDRPFVGIVSLVFLDYRRFCRLVQVVGLSWDLRNSNTEGLGGIVLALTRYTGSVLTASELFLWTGQARERPKYSTQADMNHRAVRTESRCCDIVVRSFVSSCWSRWAKYLLHRLLPGRKIDPYRNVRRALIYLDTREAAEILLAGARKGP